MLAADTALFLHTSTLPDTHVWRLLTVQHDMKLALFNSLVFKFSKQQHMHACTAVGSRFDRVRLVHKPARKGFPAWFPLSVCHSQVIAIQLEPPTSWSSCFPFMP
jgi:hypothetical protein